MLFPNPATIQRNDDEDAYATEVPLGSLTKRFYFPVILLSSLVQVFDKAQVLRMPGLETGAADVFRTFVNKLAHICDSAKGGDKVTAFGILQLGSIQYYFTSNRRDEEDYQRTSQYITGILNTLGRVRDAETYSRTGNEASLPVFLPLLRTIIRFNQNRIRGYICHMRDNLEFCVRFVREIQSNEGSAFSPLITVVCVLSDFEFRSRSNGAAKFGGPTDPSQLASGCVRS